MREQCVKFWKSENHAFRFYKTQPFYADVRVLERSDKNSTGGKEC
jgi:hypothetical protein